MSFITQLTELVTFLYGLIASFTTPKAPAKAPLSIKNNPNRPRIRLDTDASATLILPDGRKFGYAQYGTPTGRAFFYLHGHPGSRMEGAWFEDICFKLRARVISVDRPGIGWSSPHPNGTLLDHAKDVEQLAQHLGLDSYGVLGMSGGGPYVLACAAALPPEKLKCVSIVCGLGPPDIGMKGASWPTWLGFTLGYPYAPRLVGWFWKYQPLGRLDLTDEERFQLILQDILDPKSPINKKDIEVIEEDFVRMQVRSSRESFTQGYDGVMRDGVLMATDWGFRVEDIRSDLPVHIWHGKQDVNVPLNHAVQIAARLGGRAQFRVEDETHASLEIKFLSEIVENLTNCI